MRSLAMVLVVVAAGCGSNNAGSPVGPAGMPNPPPDGVDMAVPTDTGPPATPDLSAGWADLSSEPIHDGGGVIETDAGLVHVSDGGTVVATDGGPFMPPPPTDPPVAHAPPTAIAVSTLLGGLDVLDVSADQGGGVWAVTSSKVYYFPAGATSPFTYDQSNGLARGQYTWTDTWFAPGTYPVTFHSVAGGTSGEAIVGNFGEIADRLIVNPSTGAVVRVDNMQVTPANTSPSEFPEHLKRVVAAWKAVVDLNGTFKGTAYIGGFHGFYAFHGMTADCGCLAFEEHQHYITDTVVGGGDVRGLAISPDGDLWEGDREFVTLLPQRSKGPNTGLFDYDFAVGLDVFPGVKDEVASLAVDAQNGVWVASDQNGLAYLAPATHAATYYTSATVLPQNHLKAAALDGVGDLWIGTPAAGIARLTPSMGAWTYYQQASGLPSNNIRALFFAGGKMYIATDNGIAITN